MQNEREKIKKIKNKIPMTRKVRQTILRPFMCGLRKEAVTEYSNVNT